MLGRNREILDYTVRPTEEGADLLAQQALARIESIDGIDYLDGFKLPPDDDELFNPQTIAAHVTYYTERDGEIYVSQEKHAYESTLTNRWIRERNIHCIAQGMRPLFKKWEDVVADFGKTEATRSIWPRRLAQLGKRALIGADR